MPRDFFPRREADILNFSANFKNKILASAEDFGLSEEQATAYALTQAAFATAFKTASDPATGSPSAIVAKNTAREALEAQTRLLARIVRATPTVTNEMRSTLGLSLSSEGKGSALSGPDEPPLLRVIGNLGHAVTIQLWDRSSPTRRGRPTACAGAALFAYVGETPPPSLDGFEFKGNITRTTATIQFNSSIPPGSRVWITAYWYGTRAQKGPASAPVDTYIQYGISFPGSAKLAA